MEDGGRPGVGVYAHARECVYGQVCTGVCVSVLCGDSGNGSGSPLPLQPLPLAPSASPPGFECTSLDLRSLPEEEITKVTATQHPASPPQLLLSGPRQAVRSSSRSCGPRAAVLDTEVQLPPQPWASLELQPGQKMSKLLLGHREGSTGNRGKWPGQLWLLGCVENTEAGVPDERTTIVPPRKLAPSESVGRSHIGELRPSKGVWQARPPMIMRDSLLSSGFFHGELHGD